MAHGDRPDAAWHRFVMEGTATLPAAPQQVINEPSSFSLPMGPPQYDLIEALPPAAADRLRALRQRSDDAHKLSVPFEDIRQASMSRVEAENALRRLQAHAQDGGFHLPDTDARVIAAQKHLAKVTDQFDRLKQLQETRTAAWQSASGALAACEVWLRDGKPGNTTLEVSEMVEVKLAKGEGIVDAVERLRRRGRELRADLHRIQSAPFPSSHAKQRMRAQIDALAMSGAPDVSMLIEHDREIVWPSQRVQSEVIAEQRLLAFHQAPDAVALLAYLHKDALIAALDREIATEADDPAALSHADRELRSAEVMGDLLDIERQEAALVWRAMDERLPIEFRADTDPRAILQVRLVTTAASDGRDAPSSPEREGYFLIGGRR